MRLHLCDAFMIFYGMDKTSMSNSIKKRLNRKGFTLAEVLVTVAIILILAGVTFVSVAQYQKNLRLMEMDGTAKEIFIAAQNHLSVAKASGDLDRLAEKANNGASGTTASTIGTKLDSAPSYADNTSGEYYYVIHNVTSGIESYTPSGSGAILQMMLPFGALDETVATGGNYAIVYELKSASIVAVLYSGAGNASFGNAAVINFSDDDVSKINKIYNDKSERKSYEKNGVTAIVGCYTGTVGSAAIPTETLEAPKLEVKNENRLHVIVSGNYSAKDVITLTIHGVQSNTTAIKQLNCKDNDNNTFDVTLDDITSDNTRFTKILSSGRFTQSDETSGDAFIPGENIEISATARATDALATPKTSAVYTTSSLFADVNDGRTVYIQNLRHLENLSVDISDFAGNLTDKSGTTNGDITAIQKNDITMLSWDGLAFAHYLYGAGTLNDTYVAVNVKYPLSYDGGRHEIYGLSIAPYLGGSDQTAHNAGIFGNVTDTLSVKNLILRNDKIPANASAGKVLTTNAGMLLGKTSANLTVDGVLAYYHETEYNEADDSAVEVQASQVAGGLIGLVGGGKLEVKNSAAAVYVKGGNAAGGLIGSVSDAVNGSIVQSYAGGHTKGGAYNTTDAANQPVLEGPGRYNVQASGNAGGFIGVSTDNLSMDAVYSTASAYSEIPAKSGSFSGNTGADFGSKKNYYAIGPHNGTDPSTDDTAKAEIQTGQVRRQATAYDRTLVGATAPTAHPAMDKTSYPLNTIRHLCASDVEDKELPWFIREHVGDWVVSKTTKEADFEVENGNRLTVRINAGLSTSTDELKYGIKVHGEISHNDVYFGVSISNTGASVKRTYYDQGSPNTVDFIFFKNTNNDGNLGLELYLDDITQPKGHFYNTCPRLTPGEDISISVVSEINGNLSKDKLDWRNIDFSKAETQKTNSLFGYLQESDEDKHNKQKIEAVKHYNEEAGSVGMGLVTDGKGKYYVQIDNSRHLENLSPDVSSYPLKGSIIGGIQTDNIFWSGSSNANAYTAGFQEELGNNLSVYGENNQLTKDGYFSPIVIDDNNTALSSYDGSGYEISGLVAHKTTEKTSLALFLQTKHEMTIKNLTMENIDFSITGNESRAAGLIGYADKSVTIENVYFTGQIQIRGNNCTGGFVGETDNKGKLTITNSGIKGNETIASIISNNKAGGLVGYTKIDTTVKNVCFTGNLQVKGNDCTGGFIGQTDNIVNVSNSGIECDATILSDNNEAGGLIGYVNGHDATVVNAKVVGKNTEVIATKNAGGLIGRIVTCPKLTISNVGVSAFITSYSTEDSAGAGGLIGCIGEAGADSKIKKSYYGGRTTEGIYGSCTVNEGTVHERTYDANINGKRSTGGFIGCIGKADGLSIENCFSTGSVNAESEAAAAGGFIGSSFGWSQGGSISIKNCYSMGQVSGTNLYKGGFLGKLNGNISFENVFYYSAFNTVKDPVGNTPGFSGINVINDPDGILADGDSETVNTHIYDTPTLEGKEYPYKNWTTDHDDISTTMVPTYYGDWPKVPERRLKGYIAYYEVYADNTLGVYSPGVIDTLTRDMNKVRDGAQKCWYGILINSDSESDAGEYFMDSNNKKFNVGWNIPGYSSANHSSAGVPEFSTKIGTETYYLWNFTGNSDESPLRPTNFPWVRLHDLYNNYVDVNARYGAAIAPIGQLGTESYPFRIRNIIHSGNYYSTSTSFHNNDEYNDHYRDLIFVDDKKGTGPFKNKLS